MARERCKRRMTRLTILLGILAVGLVFLILNHDSGRTAPAS